MALYNVVAPGIVAGKHYTRPSAAPVEVGTVEAKPLVAAGVIEPVDAAPEPAADEKPRRSQRAKPQDGDDGQTE
ncbi:MULTISPECIES: hypothetical protein [Mycobacterium]|uniref:hypothetical protein n=1 Tax=Mycobacterium TaxID=1763 RepID=UPI000A977C94|nr:MULTISPECIES: hypothetical protein [Mycobacterium]MDP7732087.1 hypothetical protein [Mycobacterium sp. TY813]